MAKTKGISLNLMLRRPHGLAWSYMRAVRAPGFRTLGLRMLSSADASSSSVLLFGDSNTWGFDPVSHSRPDVGLLRIPHADRWTSLLRAQLPSSVDVAVDGLNARTTILHDPASPADGAYSCCGRDHLKVALHVHKPLDAVVLALGTNDLKAKFSMAPSDIAYNVRILVRDILKAEVGVGARRPAVLVLGLPRVHTTPLSTNWVLATRYSCARVAHLLCCSRDS